MQKKKRKREKAQDSGGEGSNHFPNQQKGDAIEKYNKNVTTNKKKAMYGYEN